MVLDFIFISFFGGNDFVKPISYLKMNQRVWNRDGMSNIVKIYNKVKDKFAKNEYLINVSGDLDKSLFEINFAFFKELVGEMAKQEDIAMKQIDKHQKRMFNKEEEEDGGFEIDFNNFEHSYYFSKKHVDPKHKKYRKEFSKINYRLPYKKWRKQYNSYFFKEDIGKVVEDYLKSLSFTLEYYVGGIPPSWRWVYPFRVAPLLLDIYRYLENKNKINVFENGNDKPFKPLEQLFMISNPQMTELLPDVYGKLMFDKRLKKYYPDNFELDVVVGKKYIYSDPLLPELDFKEIVGVLENVELGEEDRLLNN
jgi:5'-3' exonuclease